VVCGGLRFSDLPAGSDRTVKCRSSYTFHTFILTFAPIFMHALHALLSPVTTRSELRTVLFLAPSVTFLFVY